MNQNYIVELKYPGQCISHPDTQSCNKLHLLFQTLDTSVMDATIALLFYDEKKKVYNEDSNQRRARVKTQSDEIDQIESLLTKGKNTDSFKFESNQSLTEEARIQQLQNQFEAKELLREEARIQQLRNQMERGILPNCYEKRLIFVYAKSFLYSMDRIDKVLFALTKDKISPPNVKDAYNQFCLHFPDLREVRNTSAHLDKRIIKKEFPKNRQLILESLWGDDFCSSKFDGKIGCVKVCLESIIEARDSIQMAIDSFQWTGIPYSYPWS